MANASGFFAAFLSLLLITACANAPRPAPPPTAREQIDSIVQAQTHTTEKFEGLVLPVMLEVSLDATLSQIGRERGLGPAWNQESPRWDAIRVELKDATHRATRGYRSLRRETERDLRKFLLTLSPAELREVDEFYRSKLGRNAQEYAQVALFAMVLNMAITQAPSSTRRNAEQTMNVLTSRLTALKPSSEQQLELDSMMRQPGMQKVAAFNRANAPKALEEVKRLVSAEVNAKRERLRAILATGPVSL